MTERRKDSLINARPEKIPVDRLHYSITPTMVRALTFAHSSAGKINSMRFSHYGMRRLEIKAKHERIADMVFYAANTRITQEEVSRVLAGDVLHPRRRVAMEYARIAGVLCDGVAEGASGGRKSTPEICETYMRYTRGGAANWARFVGSRRSTLLEIPRDSINVRDSVTRIYEWIEEDDLVSDEPILRAALLFWYFSTLNHSALEKLAIQAIMEHELRAGAIDKHGLVLLYSHPEGRKSLHVDIGFVDIGKIDLTSYFERFAFAVDRVLCSVYDRLTELQDDEERLPWLSVRPPDELDRQIFDIIESHGSARTSQIVEQLNNPPPLRTLQRRLLKLCKNGLLTKQGSRRDAYYQITQRL